MLQDVFMKDNMDIAIHQEQVRLLYKNTRTVVLGHILVASLVNLAVRNQDDLTEILLWDVSFLFTLGLRYILFISFHRSESKNFEPKRWERYFLFGTNLTGVVWGALFIILLMPDNLKIGIAIFIYIFTNILLSYTYYMKTSEPIRLRFENMDLVKRLELEKERAETSQLVAEQAVQAKDRFLAAASHDLRQPLHAQGLYLDVLEKNITEQGKLQLTALRKTNTALSKLLNSLLDVSRLNAGIVEARPTHAKLKDLLLPIYMDYSEQSKALGLALELDCPDHLVVNIDVILLERIVRNLLSNAVRYTHEGVIHLRCYMKGDNTVYLSVCDTGIGIPADEIHVIFLEYHQLANPECDRDKGLGLGLAIVKKLCDLMHLSLGCSSELGKGSCFYIEVPSGSADKITTDAVNNFVDTKQGARILVIDDEQDILFGMKELLENWGYQAFLAESEETAISVLHEGGDIIPDLIVADYRLRGGKTGVGAVATIRDYWHDQEIPAMIITGDTSEDRLQEAKQSGFILLHKPVSPGFLRNALNSCLKSV